MGSRFRTRFVQAIREAQARQSPHLHRCTSRDHADDARQAWPGPDLCPKAIAALREREPSVEIEIRWCPAHKGILGNEVADGWAKHAASEPDDRGVEWLTLVDGDRLPSRPTSLAHLKRRASEKKWPEAGRGASRDDSTRGTSSGRGQARPDPSQGGEANGLEVLPAEVRAYPHGRVPEEHG